MFIPSGKEAEETEEGEREGKGEKQWRRKGEELAKEGGNCWEFSGSKWTKQSYRERFDMKGLSQRALSPTGFPPHFQSAYNIKWEKGRGRKE